MAKNLVNVSLESSVTSSDGKIKINRKNATALASALKAAQQLYAAGAIESEYSSDIKSIAGLLNSAVEDAITKALGGGRIKAGSGGFYPDYVIYEDGELTYKELKLITTQERTDNKTGEITFVRENRVKLAGGGGVTINRGVQEITTGFTSTAQTKGKTTTYETTASTAMVNTTRFVDTLLAVKDNAASIIRLLEGRTTIAQGLKATIVAKANSIEIPITHGGVLKLVSINFDWESIKKAVLSRKMRISIKPSSGDGIAIQIYFNTAIINAGLKAANLDTLKVIDGPHGKFIQEALAKIATLPYAGSAKQIKLFLKELNFDFAARYIPGSVIISQGTVKYKNPPNIESSDTKQKFITNAQWIVLTQRRLGETMLRPGEPEPPNLKERDGRFRSSVEVFANYRTSTLQYLYNPLYSSLKRYGYRPDLQVEGAIREVAQSLYEI
jgi:hypothetical protein